MQLSGKKVAVIIPAFRCKNHILKVIDSIPSWIQYVLVVDDACPEKTGEEVKKRHSSGRVEVLIHENNKGVGGGMVTGFKRAIELGVDVAVKIDGDGQMDPTLLPSFLSPIIRGEADYTKGNRFFHLEGLIQMPKIRLFGNAVLSFLNKLVSGYWNVMDPTNGYIAIHTDVLKIIPLDKLAERYFFESDLLFRLGTIRAVVQDVPMAAKYADEVSNLRISNVIITFPTKYLNRYFKRIFYNYFLRDFTAGSLFLVTGIIFMTTALIHGIYHWILFYMQGTNAPTGTVMIPVLLFLAGFQMLMFFLQQDIVSVPTRPIQQGDQL